MFDWTTNPLMLWMAEGVASAGSAAGVAVPAPKKARGPFRKVYLEELAEAEKVALAAQSAPYQALLANNWGIPSAEVTALLQNIGATNILLRGAKTSHDQSAVSTDQKDAAESDIIRAIRRIQAGARRQFDGDTANLRRFFVGVDLANDEKELDNIAEAILAILQTETLPGVGPAQISDLQNALATWNQFDDEQGAQDTAGVGGNAQVRENIAAIKKGRRAIQIAIDGEFPAPTKSHPNSNEGVRETFDLPKNKPFN